jgi:hypothetical protein
MCSEIVHIIIIIYWTFYVKIILNTILTSYFQSYFYYTKVIEILYSTYYKPNGGPNGFIFLFTKLF